MKYEFKLVDIGEGIHDAEIVQWLVKKGATIKKDQDLVKIETAKAVVDLPSPVSGKIVQIKAAKGHIKVGGVLAIIETKEKVRVKEQEKFGVVGRIPGAEGKSIFEVVKEKEMKEAPKAKAAAAPAGVKVKRKYDFFGHVDRVPVRGIRKATIDNLGKTREYLLVTATDDLDITDLWEIRKKKKEKTKVKLTLMPYILKALIEGLKDQPFINSSLEDDEIILKQYYNIGIAVALPGKEGGLLVPVLKGVDQKPLLGIAKEIAEMAEKARKRKLDIQDFKGGTITITNWGSVGGTYGTPIPNYPESCILGLGRAYTKLVKVDEEIVERRMLPISLTFDHRIIDGSVASMFMNKLKELLGNKKWIEKLK